MKSKMDFSIYDTHGESPGLLFWQTSNIWKRKINLVLAPYDTTHTQYVILAVIYYIAPTVSEVTQKLISDFSRIDSMTISNSIRLMEKKALVERKESEVDTRAKSVCLTKKGEKLLHEILPLVETADVSFFNNLSKNEYNILLQLLQKLLDNNTDKEISFDNVQ